MRGELNARRLACVLGLATALLAACLPAGCGTPGEETVTISAAASLRRVLPRLIAAYEQARGEGPRLVASYGSSGALRQQVEAGAPVDLVILAGATDVDRLIERELGDTDSRRVLARNAIVLIGPTGSAPLTFATLPALPGRERIAIGDPASVPAGRYAKQALEALGIWAALEPRLILGLDVSAVLAYVRRGEVAAGVVYRTETVGIADIVVLDEARRPWAPSPEVVAVTVRGGPEEGEARAFLAFLGTAPAAAILAEQGFLPAFPE